MRLASVGTSAICAQFIAASHRVPSVTFTTAYSRDAERARAFADANADRLHQQRLGRASALRRRRRPLHRQSQLGSLRASPSCPPRRQARHRREAGDPGRRVLPAPHGRGQQERRRPPRGDAERLRPGNRGDPPAPPRTRHPPARLLRLLPEVEQVRRPPGRPELQRVRSGDGWGHAPRSGCLLPERGRAALRRTRRPSSVDPSRYPPAPTAPARPCSPTRACWLTSATPR